MTRTLTPLSSVAEKSSRWPCFGVAARSRRTAGRKPRSAMWSASSSTVTSTAPRSQWPCWIRSSSRPGQATTMSTPRRRPWTCGCWPTPPKTVRVVSPAVGGERDRAPARSGRPAHGSGARIRARGLPRTARPAGLGEPGDERQQERVGLAGAGAAAAEDVPAGERVGQRGGLDRGGRGDVARLEGGDEVVRVRRGRRRMRSVRKTREITLDGGVSPEGSSVEARPPIAGRGLARGKT